ncbi:L-histidine N(alpha)-methyltransferase [Streptomyces sp. NPDC002265]|uniref:L-histidine N(alpha)-methyltransferase n=1 Tax=Streptomyces sp. NPDC002265 TaxID=3154415 RepID=UPI003329AC3B
MWNSAEGHIKMRLRSRVDQLVKVRELDLVVHFGHEEEWITERSAKFTEDGLRAEVAEAGLHTNQLWADLEASFTLTLATTH